MIINLPYPPSELMPNRANGKHWATTSKIKASCKLTAYLLTKNALKGINYPVGDTLPLVITFAQSDKRKRDRDGLLSAAKHLLDGVAQALNIDDSQFEPITIKRAYVNGESATIIELGY